MRNPALRLIGFGAAALTFITILAIPMAGETKRQALVQREKAQAQQQQRMRAQVPARVRSTPVADEDWRSPDYDSVRYQPEPRTDYYPDYRDVASQRSYYEPRTVVVEDDRFERATEQRRTEAEADRLTRQLDSRLYER